MNGRAVNLLRVRGAVPGFFAERHALAPEDTVAFAPEGASAQRRFGQLVAAAVLRQTAEGRYWMDLAAYHRWSEAKRRTQVVAALAICVVAALFLMLFYRG